MRARIPPEGSLLREFFLPAKRAEGFDFAFAVALVGARRAVPAGRISRLRSSSLIS